MLHLYIYLYNSNGLQLFDNLSLESFFMKCFPQIWHTLVSSCDFNSLFVNGNIFFSKPIILFECSLKIYKIFSWYLFKGIKYVYLLWRQIPKLLILNIHKEYANLFLLLKIFLDCSCIHLFFLIQVWFRFSVKNIWHFIWFHTLIKF